MTELNSKGLPYKRRPNGKAGPLGLDERYIDRSGECWIWTGGLSSEGYALSSPRTVPWSSAVHGHKRVWEATNGPVPDGIVVDHLCHNGDECDGGKSCLHRRCVNPAHLGLETRQGNLKRGSKPGRKKATVCIHGHEFTPENTYIKPNGAKACRTCMAIRSQKYYQSKGKSLRPSKPRLPKLIDREFCTRGHKVTPESIATRQNGVTECILCRRENLVKHRNKTTTNKN